VQLIAKREFSYAGRALRPGDRFEATDKHGKVLTVAKRAEPAPPEPPVVAAPMEPPERSRQTTGQTAPTMRPRARALVAQPELAPPSEAASESADAVPFAGGYSRRDLQAKDT
jgi:hypothetical protein